MGSKIYLAINKALLDQKYIETEKKQLKVNNQYSYKIEWGLFHFISQVSVTNEKK